MHASVGHYLSLPGETGQSDAQSNRYRCQSNAALLLRREKLKETELQLFRFFPSRYLFRMFVHFRIFCEVEWISYHYLSDFGISFVSLQIRHRFGLYDEISISNGYRVRHCNWIRFLRVSKTYGPQVQSFS